jgi:hypothetical protein
VPYDQLPIQEQVYLDLYQAADPQWGYNLRAEAASNRGHVFGPEVRQRVSAARQGQPSYTRTPETLAKQSEARRVYWARQHELGLTTVKPPSPCVHCGQLSKPLRKGRCHACSMYFRRHGVERPCVTCVTRR